ncbi:MAG: response regulator [Myxococcota bacterium]
MRRVPPADRRSEPAGRVLLVEDNPADVDLIATYVGMVGSYAVDHVPRVKGALERIAAGERYDIALVDLQLPDAAGPAVVTRLHAEAPELPIVVLTTLRGGSSLAERCLEAGAQDYLAKNELGVASLRRVIGFAMARQREGNLRRTLLHDDRLRSLGALAAGVAHEVNNPAAFILANLESLEDAIAANAASLPDAGDMLASVRESREGVARIRRLVENLQLFARPARERVVDVPLGQVLREATTLAMPRLRQHGARVVVEGDPLPSLAAYEGQLAQVVVNLLVNAAQAMGRRGGFVRLRGAVHPDEIRIAVVDDGEGIAPERLKRVFDPFYSTKAAGEGVGLGLALCSDIAQRHGGRIDVESELGGGSTFTLVLPRDNGLTPLTQAKDETPTLTRRPRVLLVDDETLVLRSIQRLFRKEADIVGFESGEAALAALAAGERFDAVMTDLMMPEMSGAELLERLAVSHPDLAARAIVLTGGVDDGLKESFVGAGRRVLVAKPATRADLLSALGAVLEDAPGLDLIS